MSSNWEDSLCSKCGAICCHYITVEIDKPTNKRARDDIRWYLLHEGVTLLIEEDRWLVKFPTRCRDLAKDGSCSIYENRPITCQEYSSDNCDYHTEYEGWETNHIELDTPEAFEEVYR